VHPDEVRAFYLVEFLLVFSDLAAECMACKCPWHDCLSCGVTECQREIEEWLRY
jgi:hypothetical protein